MIRRLSVIAAMLAAVSFLLGAAGISFAGSKLKKTSHIGLRDTVVISNYGAAFAGSVSTYAAGSGRKSAPILQVIGTKTGLGNSSGAAHVAVSSVDQHIAVAVPFDNFGGVDFAGDISGCGPFGVANLFGTGMVEIYSPGANGNSSPENIICSPGFAFAFDQGITDTNVTGIFAPQGVAFESPFDGVHPGMDVLAVANLFPVTTTDAGICKELGLSQSSLGTITEYNVAGLPSGIDDIAPLNNSPVSAINVLVGNGVNPFYTQNTTIGGCLSSLAGPEALTFDGAGDLYVVNNAGILADPTPPSSPAHIPRFVSVFAPGVFGDSPPFAVVGAGTGSPTAGDLISPVGITVESFPDFLDNEIFVTDSNIYTKNQVPTNNSIKVFLPFTNNNGFIYQGTLIATIQGGATHLKSPAGIALGLNDDALYVVNNTSNSFEMFTDISSIPTDPTGANPPVDNIAPTVIVASKAANMVLPVGVALPAFTPSSTASISSVGAP
jgi:hypothetical protein